MALWRFMGASGGVEFVRQHFPQLNTPYLSVWAKLKDLGLLNCFRLLNFLSMAVATTLTVLMTVGRGL
jgi:hypothetical protein